jgi:hypothetical protein
VLAIGAPLAASANTVFDYGFPTYAKCHAAQVAYQSSFTKITKACYFLAPGPRGGWAFVGETI